MRCTISQIYLINIPIYIQQDATLHSLLYLETATHVLGGTCRYRGRVGTSGR